MGRGGEPGVAWGVDGSMVVVRVVTVLLWLMLGSGCAPRLPDLPRVQGGEPLPARAVQVHVLQLERGAHLSIRSGSDEPVVHRDIDHHSVELYDLLVEEILAAARRIPGGAEIPVVLMSNRDDSVFFAMDVLVEPTEHTARQDPRIRPYFGMGDVREPRMVAAPPAVGERWASDDVATYSVLVSDDRAPSTELCAPPPGSDSVELTSCALLVADEPLPSSLGAWSSRRDTDFSPPMSHGLGERICDELDAPFDLLWDGDSLEELVEVLVDDPRPARCRGRTWVGTPWEARHHGTTRVGELLRWRESLASP